MQREELRGEESALETLWAEGGVVQSGGIEEVMRGVESCQEAGRGGPEWGKPCKGLKENDTRVQGLASVLYLWSVRFTAGRQGGELGAQKRLGKEEEPVGGEEGGGERQWGL